MRHGVIGGITGAFIAVGISLLAQATWTTPRTWVTGEVVGAGQFNTHVRDNLTYLYNALTSLDASDTTSGVFDVARIPDLGAGTITSGTFGQARLGANSVGTGQLRTAIGTSTFSGDTTDDGTVVTVTLNSHSFFPSLAGTGNCGALGTVEFVTGSFTDGVPRFALRRDCGDDHSRYFSWRYITGSDDPRVWFLLDATTRHVIGGWEAEDAPTTAPPLTVDGEGLLVIEVPIPVVSVITMALDALTPSEQTATIVAARTYYAERRWVTAFTVPADLAAVPGRYSAAARHWFMRFVAQARNETTIETYRRTLTVDGTYPD